MVTWCSGIGSRWAERRVDVRGAADRSARSVRRRCGCISTPRRSALRLPVPPSPGRLRRVPATRAISSRLTLDAPPPGLPLTPFPLRFTDFDVMGHVNNAIAFVLVEDVLARRRDLRAPLRVEVEYRSAIDRGVRVGVGGIDGIEGAIHNGWLVDEHARCLVAFRIGRLPGPSGLRISRPPESGARQPLRPVPVSISCPISFPLSSRSRSPSGRVRRSSDPAEGHAQIRRCRLARSIARPGPPSPPGSNPRESSVTKPDARLARPGPS